MTEVCLRPKSIRWSTKKNFAWSFTLGRKLSQQAQPLSIIMSSKKPAAKAPAKTAAKPAAKPAAKAGAKGAAAKGGAKAAAAPVPEKLVALPEIEVGLKEAAKVINDADGKIKDSGRWSIIVDPDERVKVFLRHRDCNMLNALDQHEMEPEKIRMALLGAIRYGKPFIIDLNESGDIAMFEDMFNRICPELPNLWNLLLSKDLIKDDPTTKIPPFMKLVKDGDGSDYTASSIFALGEGFCFAFITASIELTELTKGKLLVFRVQ